MELANPPGNVQYYVKVYELNIHCFYLPNRRWIFKGSVSNCNEASRSWANLGRTCENPAASALRSLKYPPNSFIVSA